MFFKKNSNDKSPHWKITFLYKRGIITDQKMIQNGWQPLYKWTFLPGRSYSKLARLLACCCCASASRHSTVLQVRLHLILKKTLKWQYFKHQYWKDVHADRSPDVACGLSDPESQTARQRSNTAPHWYAREPETCVYWVTGTKRKRLMKSPLPPGRVSPEQPTQEDLEVGLLSQWANGWRDHQCLCLISDPPGLQLGPAGPLIQISHRWCRQRRSLALIRRLDSCVQDSVSVPSRDRPPRVEWARQPGEMGRKGQSRRKRRRAGRSWSDLVVSCEAVHPWFGETGQRQRGVVITEPPNGRRNDILMTWDNCWNKMKRGHTLFCGLIIQNLVWRNSTAHRNIWTKVQFSSTGPQHTDPPKLSFEVSEVLGQRFTPRFWKQKRWFLPGTNCLLFNSNLGKQEHPQVSLSCCGAACS